MCQMSSKFQISKLKTKPNHNILYVGPNNKICYLKTPVQSKGKATIMEVKQFHLGSQEKVGKLIQLHHMRCQPKNSIHHRSTSQLRCKKVTLNPTVKT